MRFWQKIFLISLTILTVAINGIAYMLISNNHALNQDKEISSGLDEYSIITASLQTNVLYERYRTGALEVTDAELRRVTKESADMFMLDDLYIQLNRAGGDVVYSNLSGEVPSELLERSPEDKDAHVLIQNQGEDRAYLYISSPVVIQSERFVFTTVRDISSIYDVKNEQLRFFALAGPLVSVGVALIMLLTTKILTHQIDRLRKSTKRVAQGDYQPIPIKTNDEIGELIGDFNLMTEAVRQKVELLEEVAGQRKSFIDNMTHEMKTPLTSIIGFSDLLRSARLDDESIHDFAESIYKEGQYLKSISSKLMDIILLKREPECKPVNIEELFEEITAAVQPIAANRKIQFYARATDYVITGDKELLKSLFYNLIDNAVKASQPGKKIYLRARTDLDGTLSVSVEDQGHGIPEEELKRIFEPFYRVDKARSRAYGGAGLGLALCSEIAEVHRAELSITSKVGKGTTVTVTFPREVAK